MRFLRPVLAVVAAYATMAVVAVALFLGLALVLGRDRMFQPGTFRAPAVVSIAALGISVLAALIAGRICALITPTRKPAAVLAALVLVFGLASAVGNEIKPDPGVRLADLPYLEAVSQAKEPTWFAFLNPLVGAACVLLAATRRREDGSALRSNPMESAWPYANRTFLGRSSGVGNSDPRLAERRGGSRG